VAADDLVGVVALDPLGSRVPRGDPALDVEDEDRVVGLGLDEQAQLIRWITGG
jgi:hypothetical protein